MQTSCVLFLSSGSLAGCGGGLYAPGPAKLETPQDAGAESVDAPKADAPAAVLVTESKLFQHLNDSLSVGAATLTFPGGAYSQKEPGRVTMTQVDPRILDNGIRRGPIGFVYRIEFERPPNSDFRPTFALNLKQHPGFAGEISLDVEQLGPVLKLAYLRNDGRSEQWAAVPNGTSLTATGVIENKNLNLVVEFPSTPGELVIGVVMSCSTNANSVCEQNLAATCRAFCSEFGTGHNCSYEELCQ